MLCSAQGLIHMLLLLLLLFEQRSNFACSSFTLFAPPLHFLQILQFLTIAHVTMFAIDPGPSISALLSAFLFIYIGIVGINCSRDDRATSRAVFGYVRQLMVTGLVCVVTTMIGLFAFAQDEDNVKRLAGSGIVVPVIVFITAAYQANVLGNHCVLLEEYEHARNLAPGSVVTDAMRGGTGPNSYIDPVSMQEAEINVNEFEEAMEEIDMDYLRENQSRLEHDRMERMHSNGEVMMMSM
jgi:hypothetical protein